MMKIFIDSCRTVYFNWFLWITHSNTYWFQNEITLAYFTREDKPSSAKPPFNSNGGLAVLRLTPLVKNRSHKTNMPIHNPSWRGLGLILPCYASCYRGPAELHQLKMFEILGHPHFKQLHGHKYPWMRQTHLTGWIFISSIQVWAITPLCRYTIYSKMTFG